MDSQFIKSLFTIFIIIASIWVFNHVNAWLGISLFLGVIIYYGYKLYEYMKNSSFIILTLLTISFTACERVAPNYVGVLMENYGKNGKEDFGLQKGRVNTMAPGSELFQVPLWEQRASFDSVMHMQDADRTEYTAEPSYTYKVIESRAVDLVFQNKHLGSGDDFMHELENNILEPAIYDVAKDVCRAVLTDDLTASGANLKFENQVKTLVAKRFEEKGLELITFTFQLVPSQKVRNKIDARSEVNTNVSVIEQQIIEQKKRNELAEYQAQENIIKSKGITQQLLQQQFIEKWDGKTPLYGNTPVHLLKQQ